MAVPFKKLLGGVIVKNQCSLTAFYVPGITLPISHNPEVGIIIISLFNDKTEVY